MILLVSQGQGARTFYRYLKVVARILLRYSPYSISVSMVYTSFAGPMLDSTRGSRSRDAVNLVWFLNARLLTTQRLHIIFETRYRGYECYNDCSSISNISQHASWCGCCGNVDTEFCQPWEALPMFSTICWSKRREIFAYPIVTLLLWAKTIVARTEKGLFPAHLAKTLPPRGGLSQSCIGRESNPGLAESSEIDGNGQFYH